MQSGFVIAAGRLQALCAAALLVLGGAACSPAQPTTAEEPMIETPVRVIVTLELPGDATEAGFAEARGSLLSLLADRSFSVIREFPSTGQLLLEMQRGDLAVLEAAPGVRSVREDRLLRPQGPPREEG